MNLHPDMIKYIKCGKILPEVFSPTNKNEIGLWTKPWEDLVIFYKHQLLPDRTNQQAAQVTSRRGNG